MPVITETVKKSGTFGSVVTWSGMASGDTGAPFFNDFPMSLAMAVQVEGTFGGASVYLSGSVDGVNYHTLKTLDGGDAQMTVAGIMDVSSAVAWLRPSVQGGSGSNITVAICMKG